MQYIIAINCLFTILKFKSFYLCFNMIEYVYLLKQTLVILIFEVHINNSLNKVENIEIYVNKNNSPTLSLTQFI